jgi:nitroreductase
MTRRAPTDREILDVLAARHSSRAIDSDEPVDRETLATLLEAARWAPSSFNEQPWRYIILDEAEGLEAARACLSETNRAWAGNAPVLILSSVSLLLARNGRPNRHAAHDVGMANMALALQATHLGLALRMMAGFDFERAREAFGVPEGFEPLTLIAVGHSVPAETLPEPIQEKERAPRQRKALSEIVFDGHWGRPLRSPAP